MTSKTVNFRCENCGYVWLRNFTASGVTLATDACPHCNTVSRPMETQANAPVRDKNETAA